MKILNKHLLTTISFLLLSSSYAIAQTTIITNVQGYTLSDKQLKEFTAIQFTHDKIDKLFTKGETVPQSENVTVIDGQGKTLLPGLIDAHGHILSYGLSLMQANLVGTLSEDAAVESAINYAKANPGIAWIQGRGWNQTQWENTKFPTAKSLDKHFPNTPVWLSRVDGHAGWANTKAMELAGITSATKSPAGGDIIRDESGKPTGIFIDNAMDLMTKSIAPLTRLEQKLVLKKALNKLVSFGLTSVHDAGIFTDNLELFKELSSEGSLPIRINAMLYLPSKNWQATLKQGPFNSRDDMLNFNSVKIQADGALGSRGASLIADYSDHAGHKGLMLHEKEALTLYMNTAMNAGFQVNTHAIGDNANKVVLDLYQAQIKATQTQALRHRVEHAQILRLSDIPRFAELNIIASMQATHATSDKNMAVDRIGKQRILGAYAWRKLMNANAVIAAGSDFPVESPNPFFGLHSSVTRQDQQNLPENGWYNEESMTRLEAFRSFTIDAAYSAHQEKVIGSLAAGKKADFILLENNYFTENQQNIWNNKVLATWVNGKQVYQQ
ncbi:MULTISPECIES: amidohydrolase [unclassified Colwellia]|uniref:amidohydrolase n=1 Tax=unclassified Colwellia TaxID=196834 RepID=UPI0015F574B2|nr:MULTISPECIES: amidohydrolase [unclassified Colwellia]MBA6230984.1 amidohydrolase family protein [Colwellia sp. MB02u-7]MBA6234915.1 amidohydrolase family protein [Colwellia sp. MB02u-11]MBA6255779.1 amidohydrolase family protein [Colwellia sp. MB3u-28]MBA6261920.1 amidohydrolase family protein [Colwellia sp. MB3u-41]MBA6301470.1 amidohydrolase family protein [Colwellia sp. MB3u-22]